jgi:hypothetical protein
MSLRALSVAVALSAVCPAWAQTQAEVDASAHSGYELARSFSECAGFWDFLSAAEEASGNPASAQNAHNVGNGARLSAGYVLSVRHRLQRPSEPPRAYGSWNDFIEPLAEVTATRMMAALERGDVAEVEEQAITCRAMSETSQGIVDRMRSETAY